LKFINDNRCIYYDYKTLNSINVIHIIYTYIEEQQGMGMLKVIEVLAESQTSWEDAAQVAVSQATKSVRNVRSIYIKEMEATVDNGRITGYRVNAKISFVLE
jgi:flavin-binding protein dodecin